MLINIIHSLIDIRISRALYISGVLNDPLPPLRASLLGAGWATTTVTLCLG